MATEMQTILPNISSIDLLERYVIYCKQPSQHNCVISTRVFYLCHRNFTYIGEEIWLEIGLIGIPHQPLEIEG